MKLLCTVSKILMCWKLCHETPIEDGLRIELQKKKVQCIQTKVKIQHLDGKKNEDQVHYWVWL